MFQVISSLKKGGSMHLIVYISEFTGDTDQIDEVLSDI